MYSIVEEVNELQGLLAREHGLLQPLLPSILELSSHGSQTGLLLLPEEPEVLADLGVVVLGEGVEGVHAQSRGTMPVALAGEAGRE